MLFDGAPRETGLFIRALSCGKRRSIDPLPTAVPRMAQMRITVSFCHPTASSTKLTRLSRIKMLLPQTSAPQENHRKHKET